MKKQKKILMLGGSAQQVPAINAAKAMGYYTVLIDYLPDNPGQYSADKWYMESTTDIDAVYRIAVEEDVCGILPYASDPAALPAAIVCERLGLPTNPVKSVEILGVKHKFRDFLTANNFACPRKFIFSPESHVPEILEKSKNLKFPIVIKPTDSSGSKGVSFVNDLSEIEKAISYAKSYSHNGILIAEEFIKKGFPNVIGGDIFVENGRIVLLGEMACMRDNNGNGFIPIGKKRPSGLNSQQKANLHIELQRLITLLEIRGGEFNIEAIIDEDNNVHFLEVGPRAGGNMIPIELSDAFGIDLLKANVAIAMGEPTNLKINEPTDCFMTFVLHSNANGIYQGINYAEEIEPFIYRKVHYKNIGEKVETFDGAGKALGIVFMRFKDMETMNSIHNRIDNLIKIMLK